MMVNDLSSVSEGDMSSSALSFFTMLVNDLSSVREGRRYAERFFTMLVNDLPSVRGGGTLSGSLQCW